MGYKLILFDLDGTIIRSVDSKFNLQRFSYAVKKTFDLEVNIELNNWSIGVIDRNGVWELIKDKGVSFQQYLAKLPELGQHARDFLLHAGLNQILYRKIESAEELIHKLISQNTAKTGVLTGNFKPVAVWKLEHTDLAQYFNFGLYGEEADNRNELAKLVFAKAKSEFDLDLKGEEIVVVGDTIHDLRCGKAIGAKTIIVTNGVNTNILALEQEHPNLLIDSLMDPRVLEFFEL